LISFVFPAIPPTLVVAPVRGLADIQRGNSVVGISDWRMIMLKLLASTVLAGSLGLATAQPASACGGGLFGCKTKCAPAPAATCAAPATEPTAPAATPATPDTAPTPPATAQNGRIQYRSYSYDAAAAPAYRAHAAPTYSRPYDWRQYQFRADRKMRGL